MKGQIQQVFIYILTIVVVGIIILIGYKAISGMISKGCDVERTTFSTDIESFIQKYNTYGSVNIERMNVPCSYEQICFVGYDVQTSSFSFSSNPIIENSWKSDIKDNIFLVSTDLTDPIGSMTEIRVDNKFICINNTNGRFNIRFEGLGRNTKISVGSN